MLKSIDSLLSEREQVRETETNLTYKIISEAEKYVLSTIYLASKINSEHFVSVEIIRKAIKHLYNPKIESSDINQALANLIDKGTVHESKNRDPRPNDYGIATGEFGEVPVIEYISEEEAKKRKKEAENLPF